MNVETLAIPGLLVVTPTRNRDSRGFFSETWNQRDFAAIGISGPFVQDNHAVSNGAGVVRGLHCQIGAHAQGKLVRVVKGEIWDVAVDIRTGSPTYGQHAGVKISADNWSQFWCPVGFLHGYCTLTEETEVIYKVTSPYNRGAERGVRWNDHDLNVAWPIAPGSATLSDRDAAMPFIKDCDAWF